MAVVEGHPEQEEGEARTVIVRIVDIDPIDLSDPVDCLPSSWFSASLLLMS